jgi:hypothetical protein
VIFTRTMRVHDRNRTHNVLAMMGLALLASMVACSGHPAALSPDGQRATQSASPRLNQPVCGPSQDGQVRYGWSDSKFSVCRGDKGAWVETNLTGPRAKQEGQALSLASTRTAMARSKTRPPCWCATGAPGRKGRLGWRAPKARQVRQAHPARQACLGHWGRRVPGAPAGRQVCTFLQD